LRSRGLRKPWGLKRLLYLVGSWANPTSNTSLLLLQHKHVTKSTREGNKRVLRAQRHTIWVLKHLDIVNPQVQTLIYNAGFDHLLKISDFDINHHLITTLVERWRIEAHTFHFPLRECTITLENVALQLAIDREPVTGVTYGDLFSLYKELLRFLPPAKVIKGNAVKLSWLNNVFWELSNNATEVVISQHARKHILTLIENYIS